MTISKITTLVLPALIFIGCSNSPKGAVENMYDALQSGNAVKLANNVAETMSISLMSESIKECSLDKNNYKDEQIKLTNSCLKEKYSNLKYKDIKANKISEDEADVEVTLIENNAETKITFAVQNIKGRWMVVSRKKQ